MKKKNKKGFTIIELIVVMAVIGVLVLLAIPKFMGYTKEAKLTQIKSDIRQLENASERYYMDTNEWPKLTEEHYTKEQLEEYAKDIKDKTGATILLEDGGKYYPIDYSKLQIYVQKPRNNVQYIIQNPVGQVYYLDKLTEMGKTELNKQLDDNDVINPVNNKPTAVITMTPEKLITTKTSIVWGYSNSTDTDGDEIVNVEWEGKQDLYGVEGTYTVKLRVQDEHGLWSEWVEKTFTVNTPPPIEGAVGYRVPIDSTIVVSATYENTPNHLIDGLVNPGWSAPSYSAWINISFKEPEMLNGVQLITYATSDTNYNFVVYGKKDGNWVKLTTKTLFSKGNTKITQNPISVPEDFYEGIRIEVSNTASWVSLSEVLITK